jgi:hypothetical protein
MHKRNVGVMVVKQARNAPSPGLNPASVFGDFRRFLIHFMESHVEQPVRQCM